MFGLWRDHPEKGVELQQALRVEWISPWSPATAVIVR
jgi:hypothetical protein